MCGFIAQLVEHLTGIEEVTGSNPVEALIFFRLLLSDCFNWKLYCDDHSLHSLIVLANRNNHSPAQKFAHVYVFSMILLNVRRNVDSEKNPSPRWDVCIFNS